MRYEVQATVEYTLEVEANSEEEAIERSYDIPFDEWEEHEVAYDAVANDDEAELAEYWPQEGDVLRAYLGGSRRVFLVQQGKLYAVLTHLKGESDVQGIYNAERERAELVFSAEVAADTPSNKEQAES